MFDEHMPQQSAATKNREKKKENEGEIIIITQLNNLKLNAGDCFFCFYDNMPHTQHTAHSKHTHNQKMSQQHKYVTLL